MASEENNENNGNNTNNENNNNASNEIVGTNNVSDNPQITTQIELINNSQQTEKEEKPVYETYKEFVIFKHEYNSMEHYNSEILDECVRNKRLLDLNYDTLFMWISYFQTSIIFFSTFSGFIQATKSVFSISEEISFVISIVISTYTSLLLSISKFYKLDEQKEKIHNLREQYSLLQNSIKYRIDVLEQWRYHELWLHQDPIKRFEEWCEFKKKMEKDFLPIVKNKQDLFTQFEIIMDTKQRNKYVIVNKERMYNNNLNLLSWIKKEKELENTEPNYKDLAKEYV